MALLGGLRGQATPSVLAGSDRMCRTAFSSAPVAGRAARQLAFSTVTASLSNQPAKTATGRSRSTASAIVRKTTATAQAPGLRFPA